MCFNENWRYQVILVNNFCLLELIYRWPLATKMSSRRQRSIPSGGRCRQVSLYCVRPMVKWLHQRVKPVARGNWLFADMVNRCWPITHFAHCRDVQFRAQWPSGHITQKWRRYYVKTTSLWRYYVTMTSFWRNNDVIITSCVQGGRLVGWVLYWGCLSNRLKGTMGFVKAHYWLALWRVWNWLNTCRLFQVSKSTTPGCKLLRTL